MRRTRLQLHRPLRRGNRSRGQSLVELALILPVALVLFSAALDFGRLAAARVTISNVAREGAFQAATTPASYQAGQPCPTPNPSTGTTPDTNLVVCRALLEAKGTTITVNPSDIAVTCTPDCSLAMGNTVTVKVTGRFSLLTPIMAAFFGGSTLSFSATSTNQLGALPTPPPGATPTPTPTPNPSASAAPTATPPPYCALPSAGFTYTITPSSNKSPVTISVTDTSTSAFLCPITVWAWNWGDGVTTYGQVQSPHTYYNSTKTTATYGVRLTVTNIIGSNTSGAVTVTVKP